MKVLLIDADNFNSPQWIEESIAKLQAQWGQFSVLRAYGSATNLKAIHSVMGKCAIRSFENLALSKNTTDVALAVDAMELACQSPRPTLIAIASGDADFLPLVVRLRERGITMVVVSHPDKMKDEVPGYYDHTVLVGTGATRKPATSPKAKTAAKKAAKAAESAGDAVSVKTAAKTVAQSAAKKATKTATKKATKKVDITTAASSDRTPEAKTTAEQGLDATALQILQLIPTLQGGQWHPLGEVAKQLHDAKILGKNATSTKLFKKYAQFELKPAGKPNQVRYTHA